MHFDIPTQNKDYSASNTRVNDNDAQFIPIYTKLHIDEIFRHNTSLGVTMSRTCPIVPFTGVQLSQQSANTSGSSVVLSDTLFRRSAGIRMERVWPKAVHHQIHAKQLLVGIRWLVRKFGKPIFIEEVIVQIFNGHLLQTENYFLMPKLEGCIICYSCTLVY